MMCACVFDICMVVSYVVQFIANIAVEQIKLGLRLFGFRQLIN